MILQEEVLAKLLVYKIENDLTEYLEQVKLEWESSHILDVVASGESAIVLPADPLPLDTSITDIIIAGEDDIDLDQIDRYPCVYIFVTDVTPGTSLLFQQEDVEEDIMAAAIRIIHEGTVADVLEKQIYRYVGAIYRMMRNDRYLEGLGWFVDRPARHYSAIVPSEPLLKAGQVSFVVKAVSVA